MGKLILPKGKRIAVTLALDCDGQSVWLGGFNRPTPCYMSRGQFGMEVGLPRILDLFQKYDIQSTFFFPGHTIETFPDVAKRVRDAGHEIGIHGYYHEVPLNLAREDEARLQQRALEAAEKVLGVRPVGYRSPCWDHSVNTMSILEENGFEYDSSLMGRDFELYRPQEIAVHWETPNVFGRASQVLEVPVSWYVDDWPPLAYMGSGQTGMQDTDVIFRRWADSFWYCYNKIENGNFITAMHPQIIGQSHHMMFLERFIQYIKTYEGVWFTSTKNVVACWQDDAEDKRRMALSSNQFVESKPEYYSFE